MRHTPLFQHQLQQPTAMMLFAATLMAMLPYAYYAVDARVQQR